MNTGRDLSARRAVMPALPNTLSSPVASDLCHNMCAAISHVLYNQGLFLLGGVYAGSRVLIAYTH